MSDGSSVIYVTTGARLSGIPNREFPGIGTVWIPGWEFRKILKASVQNFDKENTAKFASFATVICITKAHKCISHLHTLQDSRAGLTLLLYYSDSHCTVVVMPYVICQYFDVWFLSRADAWYWYIAMAVCVSVIFDTACHLTSIAGSLTNEQRQRQSKRHNKSQQSNDSYWNDNYSFHSDGQSRHTAPRLRCSVHSTQPFILTGLINRVPTCPVGVKAGRSPLSGGR